MKTIITICLLSIALMLSHKANAVGGVLAGSGTAGSPYLVADYADLKAIGVGYALSAEYRLTADIDASASVGENAGAGFTPIGLMSASFTGKLHGGGHEITDLFINLTIDFGIGLIGFAEGAYVDSLGLINVNISGVGSATGALIGAGLSSTVIACFSSGVILGSDVMVGGLVGANMGESNLLESFSICNVSGSSNVVGGIAGKSEGSVLNCYALGSASALGEIGGLIGANSGVVSNCFSIGSVVHVANSGGLVGANNIEGNNGTITNCFWDTITTGQLTSDGGGSGLSTIEMKSYSTFINAGWDFQIEPTNGSDDIWGIDESGVDNNGYPFLSIQALNHQLKASVTTLAASSVLSTTATINGTVNANNATTAVSFEYGLTTGYGTTATSSPASASGTGNTSVSSALTGLIPSTTYHYRVVGVNSAGTSNGSDLTFTTSAGGTVPVDLPVSNSILTGNSECFNATNTITVAGDPIVVEVEAGADATFIAEQNILFLPGFHAISGSYVSAYITTTGAFCADLPASVVVVDPIAIKSSPIDSEQENSIEEQELMKVYPNPNSGKFTVELANFKAEVHLMVFNAVGAMVHQASTNNESISLDLSNRQRGIYFVRAISGDKQIVQKVIVQ